MRETLPRDANDCARARARAFVEILFNQETMTRASGGGGDAVHTLSQRCHKVMAEHEGEGVVAGANINDHNLSALAHTTAGVGAPNLYVCW